MNVLDIEAWKKIIPNINCVILQEYLKFCQGCNKEVGEQYHHVFPRGFSKKLKIDEIKTFVGLTVEEHLHAHELIYQAVDPRDTVLKASAAGAVYAFYRWSPMIKQLGVENPNFQKGFLWWWKHNYSMDEYEKRLQGFKDSCSERMSGSGNPMYGKPSANLNRGYYSWWVGKYGEKKAQEKNKEFGKKVSESLKKHYEKVPGTFNGKNHSANAKELMREHRCAVIKEKGSLCSKITCADSGEVWNTLESFLTAKNWSTSIYYKYIKSGVFPDGKTYKVSKHFYKGN